MSVRRSDDVLCEIVDGTAMLVDPNGRELFTLNTVGTMVWEELAALHDARAIAAALESRLDGVGRAQLESDISAFLAELRTAGLVVDRA